MTVVARRLVAFPVASALVLAIAVPGAARADQLPARVHAEYEIHFNGLKVGGFDFHTSNDAASYKMEGAGKVSVMFGAFKWNGSSSASGAVDKVMLRPAMFNFDLKGKSKAGTTQIAFANGAVSKVDMTPPPKPKPDAIAVEPHHLKGALDPMTAVMAMTRGGANPCQRTVPVFDGQRRLDIVLSAHGQTTIQPGEPASAPVMGQVCHVNYKLIAGHRPGDETTYMNRNQHIEMVLRPVPAANVYVPYQITAWTLLGKIRVFAKRVTITPAAPASQQIVLLH